MYNIRVIAGIDVDCLNVPLASRSSVDPFLALVNDVASMSLIHVVRSILLGEPP